MDDEPLNIERELRALTEASVWLIRPTRYLRLSRAEAPRPPTLDVDGATEDATWHEHVGVWQQRDLGGMRLRILPAGRSDGAQGVLTGLVESLTGR